MDAALLPHLAVRCKLNPSFCCSLLDARLLADAEERLRQLNLQHSREQRQQEAAAAAAQSPVRLPTATLMPRHSPAQHHPQPPPAALDHRRAPPPPQPIQPAVASETQQRLDRLRAMVARSSPPQKPLPATLARPSPAGAATRIPGSAHQQRARSPQPLANGYQPPTAPANDSRVPAAASRLGNGPTLSHSQPSSMLTFGGPLQQVDCNSSSSLTLELVFRTLRKLCMELITSHGSRVCCCSRPRDEYTSSLPLSGCLSRLALWGAAMRQTLVRCSRPPPQRTCTTRAWPTSGSSSLLQSQVRSVLLPVLLAGSLHT